MKRKTFLLVVVLVLALVSVLSLAVGIVYAKIPPYLEDSEAEWGDLAAPTEIPSAVAMMLHVGRLGEFGDVDAFRVTFDAPAEDWPFQLAVPVCGEFFTPFYPSIAVIGPELNKPGLNALPFDVLLQDENVQVFAEKDDKAAERIQRTPDEVTMDFDAYQNTHHTLDIPAAGEYIFALWEPEGHVGAYMFATGEQQDMFLDRSDEEIEAAFNQLFQGDWMGQDCKASLAVESCAPTASEPAGDANLEEAPVRLKVGEGYAFSGVVRDSDTCLPVAGARILFWLVNEQGEYDEAHRATVITNRQGAFRFESNRPGSYGPEAHIHYAIRADGYTMLVQTHVLRDGVDSVNLNLNLRPG